MSVAGVSGNGQSALADVLCGTLSPTAGHIRLRGQALRAWPSWLVEQGVARIPEDRHAVGVIGDLPLWENAVAERLRSRAFSRLSWIRRKVARQHADKVISHFDIRGGGATTAARTLSSRPADPTGSCIAASAGRPMATVSAVEASSRERRFFILGLL